MKCSTNSRPRSSVRPAIASSFSYNPSAAILREIDGGAAFDVAIVTRPAIDRLAAQGKIVRESCADIGRCGLGVAVRKGARKPDIGTVDAFKRALLAAKSVVRSRDGASGQYFETLLDRLGIAEAMRGKIVIGPAGRIAELVARGEAELAVQQVPELMPVKGADFVGPFPDELQVYTVFAAGVAAASQQRDVRTGFHRRLGRAVGGGRCSKPRGLNRSSTNGDAARSREENAMRPFEGIRVIDVTHVLAGPFAAYQLAVLGADVIKVEHPDDPDQSRGAGTDKALNRAQHGHGVPDAGLQQALDHARPEAGRGSRDSEEAGRDRRRVRGELPARRVRGARPRLRGARRRSIRG